MTRAAVRLSVCILLLTIPPASICAATLKQATSHQTGPYCGVYSVYGALVSLGLAEGLDPASLLQTKYVGSSDGSTMAELQQAVHDLRFGSGNGSVAWSAD